MKFNPRLVLPFFVMSLLVGIFGGWIRMGWGIDLEEGASHHGVIMTGGFLGGLISLERASTMKSRWWLAFPAMAGISILFFLMDFDLTAHLLITFTSAGLLILCIERTLVRSESYWYFLLAGALFWLIGNLKLLQTDFVPASVGWWIGFILFTIFGERLELSRFVPVPKTAKAIFWFLSCLLLISFLLPFHSIGRSVNAFAILLLTVWFLRHDIARKSVRKPGIFRYTGLSMMVAYGWLVVHCIILMFKSGHSFFYDLYLHTFFLGFAFSMIWAHAPSILPAVLKLRVKLFHPVLWVFWWLFQLTLAGRVMVTFLAEPSSRKILVLINGIALLLMLASMMLILVIRLRQRKRAAR
ncbi:hypothetical protein [Halocola ammonii]